MGFSEDVRERLEVDAKEIIARYPEGRSRSALRLLMKLRLLPSNSIRIWPKLIPLWARRSFAATLRGPAPNIISCALSNSIQTIRPRASGIHCSSRWKVGSVNRCARRTPVETSINSQSFHASAFSGVRITRGVLMKRIALPA